MLLYACKKEPITESKGPDLPTLSKAIIEKFYALKDSTCPKPIALISKEFHFQYIELDETVFVYPSSRYEPSYRQKVLLIARKTFNKIFTNDLSYDRKALFDYFFVFNIEGGDPFTYYPFKLAWPLTQLY